MKRYGLQNGFETCYDVSLGDCGIGKKTRGQARGDRVDDTQTH